ncbi:hypothetical protein HMPREF0972_00860 [Actinomyces sp. oral taxon 848 str. F0332]|nr:hypothetical protein HMPREF0972_00860 [Actinomyces sp. oral taxon 848 str. F0332]
MRAARTRRWFVLALILGLTAGCAEDMSKPGAGELLGQGSKDYWDRQTIEDYQRKTIPAIEEFMRRLLADGGGQHYAAEGANELTLCETKTDGREYMSAVYETQVSVPPTKIRAIAKETIEKAGLKIEQQDDERDNATGFGWSDSKNGGFLMLSAHPTKGISFHFVSGCRPSATKIDDPPPLKGVPTVPFTPQQETPSPSAASPSS